MSTNPLRPELKWNRFDTLVALTVALLAIVSALLFYLPKTGGGDQLTLVITVGGQEQSRTPVTQLPDGPVRIGGDQRRLVAAPGLGQVEQQCGDDGQQRHGQRHQRVKPVPFQLRTQGVGRHRRCPLSR